ncbi:MAG: BON domain-containing protein [Pyrinomonadaceae bacterium]
MRKIKSRIITIVAIVALATSAAFAASKPSVERSPQGQRNEKIRKQLVTLPYYGVFDNLAYKVEGGTVTLYGQVVRPTTRSEAARRVAKVEGVARVINNIEVLPVSGFDDSIRSRAYRSINRTAGLYRYMLGVNPSIHIVVKNGNVTLEGVVSNKADKTLAYMAVNQVPGVFSVTNNLVAESELPR